MNIENDEHVLIDPTSPAGTDPAGNSSRIEAAARLKMAIDQAGGPSRIARLTGVPLASLNRVRAGHETKARVLLAVADATGVRLEWLVAGRGPMRPGAEPAPAPPAPTAASGTPRPLFATVDIDRLGRALEQAGPLLQAHQGRIPDARRFAQILLLLYDDLAAAEKSSSPPET